MFSTGWWRISVYCGAPTANYHQQQQQQQQGFRWRCRCWTGKMEHLFHHQKAIKTIFHLWFFQIGIQSMFGIFVDRNRPWEGFCPDPCNPATFNDRWRPGMESVSATMLDWGLKVLKTAAGAKSENASCHFWSALPLECASNTPVPECLGSGPVHWDTGEVN